MDPFHSAEWLLAAELAALLGGAVRWDWSDSHQDAARLSRELADSAFAGRDLASQPELLSELGRAIENTQADDWMSKITGRSTIAPEASHALDRLSGWRAEAKALYHRLHRIIHPGIEPKTEYPPQLFE